MTVGQRVTPAELPGIVEKGQCMGCGFCSVVLDKELEVKGAACQVDYRWIPEVEHWGPVVTSDSTDLTDNDRRICPGKAMNMPELAQNVFGQQPADPMVGEVLCIASGHAADRTIRRQAASGGVATALAAYLFQTNQIDGCYCSAGNSPESGSGFLARNVDELKRATGSHYHPIAFGNSLNDLVNGTDRFAFIGLPCEIAAMRQLMSQRADVAKRCVLLIGLFCGGINRYSGIGQYLMHFDINPHDVQSIDYRDGTWPGQISVIEKDNKKARKIPRIRGNSRWNILRYMVSFQAYWMLPRCRICPDQISDFADIALGDPHLPRFKSKDSEGHSAIVARTERGMEVLQRAEADGDIVLSQLSRDELVQSQGYTLENRRYARVYTAMAQRLGFTPPAIEVYDDLKGARSAHQHVYAFVDLFKIRVRNTRWLAPFHLPIQVFEYLFLTLSPRLIVTRLMKLFSNR